MKQQAQKGPKLPMPSSINNSALFIRQPVEGINQLNSDDYACRDADNITFYTNNKTRHLLNGLFLLVSLGSESFGDQVHGSVPIASDSGRLIHGVQHGKWKTNIYDGNTYTETYRRGILHGPFVALDSAGRPAYRTTFTNGTGYFKRFHRNGRVAYEVLYWHNRPHGWAYTYAPNGALVEETLYQHGQLVRTVKHEITEP